MRATSPFFQAATLLLAVTLLLAACDGPPALSQNGAMAAAETAFNVWATDNGEPYRDVQIIEDSNDGDFAQMYVTAWFRPTADAEWEERLTVLECRQVGEAWQCDPEFKFVLSRGEINRRTATATAVAIPTVTAQAVAQATNVAKATAQAQARATDQVIAEATAVAKATAQAQATATAQADALAASIAQAPDSAARLGFTTVQISQETGVISAVNPRNGAIYVYVPAGDFLMGTPIGKGPINEFPQHTVYLNAYWIMQTEVTNAQYAACVAAGGCSDPQNLTWLDDGSTSLPVTDINWHQAQDYAQWVGGSLPSEEEWEKAGRGTDDRPYPWGGDDPTCERLNFNDCLGYVVTAGSFPGDVSPYGVLDMAGNVTEWTRDRYTTNYFDGTPAAGQVRPAPNTGRVVRGGSFSSSESRVRLTYRAFGERSVWSNRYGFRLVATMP